MSRKMIDYQVEGGKITSIDGYKVGGGDELTGEAIMNATKDSDTITRTLDTDGKVKLDAAGGVSTLSLYQYSLLSNKIHINSGTYAKGQNIASGIVLLSDTDYGFSKVVCATNFMLGTQDGDWNYPKLNGVLLNVYVYSSIESGTNRKRYDIRVYTTDALTVDKTENTKLSYQVLGYK